MNYVNDLKESFMFEFKIMELTPFFSFFFCYMFVFIISQECVQSFFPLIEVRFFFLKKKIIFIV